jgi:hypothetical protein
MRGDLTAVALCSADMNTRLSCGLEIESVGPLLRLSAQILQMVSACWQGHSSQQNGPLTCQPYLVGTVFCEEMTRNTRQYSVLQAIRRITDAYRRGTLSQAQ